MATQGIFSKNILCMAAQMHPVKYALTQLSAFD
jgi:hypothetical protein